MFVGWLRRLYVGSWISVVGMRRSIIARQMIGGIVEMMNDPKLFRKSDIGRRHEYSNWTEAGREALNEFVEEYSKKLLVAEEQDLDARAKEMTWQALKEKAE